MAAAVAVAVAVAFAQVAVGEDRQIAMKRRYEDAAAVPVLAGQEAWYENLNHVSYGLVEVFAGAR